MDFPALDGMTLLQMQTEFVDLGQQMSAISVRRDCLLKAIGQKKADAIARSGLSGMSNEERAALRLALGDSE